MQRALILLAVIVGAILIAAALEDRGAEIKDRKAEAGAVTTATASVDPAQATIEALQTQIAGLASGGNPAPTQTPLTPEPTQGPSQDASRSNPPANFGEYPKDNVAAAEMFGGAASNWYPVGSNGWGFRDVSGQVKVPAGWRLDYTGHSCEHMTEQGIYGSTVMVPPYGAGTLWFVPGETGCGRGISA